MQLPANAQYAITTFPTSGAPNTAVDTGAVIAAGGANTVIRLWAMWLHGNPANTGALRLQILDFTGTIWLTLGAPPKGSASLYIPGGLRTILNGSLRARHMSDVATQAVWAQIIYTYEPA